MKWLVLLVVLLIESSSSTPIYPSSETNNNVINNNVTTNNNSSLITDNLSSPHRSQQQQQQQDNPEWEILYDKEIGTWCQPASDLLPPPPPAATHLNSEQFPNLQRMTTNPVGSTTIKDSAMLTRWVDAALKLVRSQTLHINCSSDGICPDETEQQQQSTTTAGGNTLNRPVASNMNLYVAMATDKQQKSSQKFEAVLPDGALTKTGAHDVWVVLDPTPQIAFGHTLYVFVVDFNTSDVNCIAAGGIPLGKNPKNFPFKLLIINFCKFFSKKNKMVMNVSIKCLKIDVPIG